VADGAGVRPAAEPSRKPIPEPLRPLAHRLRDAAVEGATVARQLPRWRRLLRTPPAREAVRVSYGVERMPGDDEVVYGGRVKFQELNRLLPNAPDDFNVLYLGSTAMPLDARALAAVARRRRAAFVWNQNGVCYPAWFGPGCERLNRPRARLLHAADHVVYQSAFCKLAADRWYGERRGPWEVLHNPVDTTRFTPAEQRPERPPTLLLGGNQYQRYRLDAALETLAAVRRTLPEARLLVTGAVAWHADARIARAETDRLVDRLGLAGAVEFTGPYTQPAAPELMRRGDVLLHTKVNDPCPSVVLEAMACGLPVVHSATGGTPELVGEEAGIGVPGPLDWEREHPPPPAELAAAAVRVLADRDAYGAAARERAVERFDLRRWAARHEELFETLVAARRRVS
jgi:glycosyltransferase involved in cell wall biosynthesis